MTPPESASSSDPPDRIFAYRAIDLRDRFPQPLETFREALECLQSDRSYMAAMSGEIIAYLHGGCCQTIPDHFFLRNRSEIDATLVPADQNDAICDKVEAWIRRALAAHEEDLPDTVPLEDRPYSLDELLHQCELGASEFEELKEWQDTPNVGREILDLPCERDVWQAAERLFGSREGAKRWMMSSEIAFRGRIPAEVAVEDPQQVYDLIMRLEYGVYT